MAESTSIIEQEAAPQSGAPTKLEDGQGSVPTPPESTPAENVERQQTAPQGEAGAAATNDAGSPGTATAPEQDREAAERKIFDALVTKHSSPEPRKAADQPPSPSSTTATAAPATAATARTQQAQTPAGAEPDVSIDEYGGSIDKESLTALKRVGWLLPPDDWKAKTLRQRADLVDAAKIYRAEKDRQFQQQKQAQATPAPAPQGGQTPASPGGFQGQPAQQTQQQAQQPAVQKPGQPTLPNEIEQRLHKIEEEYGKELADHQRAIELFRQQQFDEALSATRQAATQTAQQQQQFTQAQQEREQQLQQAIAMAQAEAIEESVLSSLERDFPQLKDPEVRNEIRVSAKAMDQAHWSTSPSYQQRPLSDRIRESVVTATRGKFFSEIQTQERKRLSDARERSLAGTMDRGVSRPGSSKPAPVDRDRAAFEALKAAQSKGMTREERIAAAVSAMR